MSTTGGEMSPWRAWGFLVWLSLVRQARARQMVWIGVALMVLSVVVVLVFTRLDRWGMHQWRTPRGRGPTYPVAVTATQTLGGLLNPDPVALAVQSATCGAAQMVLSPTARTEDGRVLGASAFQVFSRGAVFSIFLTFLLPVFSLAFATDSLGGEREAGTLIWLLTRPLPRPAIFLGKYVALLPWSIAFNLAGFAAMCIAAGPPGWLALRLFWPAVVCATVAFSSLFFVLGAAVRWPAVVGMLYSFCLEVVLGNMPGYLQRVSISYYTRCLLLAAAEGQGVKLENTAVFVPVDAATAVAVLLGGSAAALAAGVVVFSQMEFREQV